MIELRREGSVVGMVAMLAAVSVFVAHPVAAAAVTVSVTAQSAATVEDTILVFDPLDAAPPPSHDAAIIDQADKRFVPRINIIRTGTSVTFPNSDHIRHQVYSFSPAKVFTLKLYAGSPQTAVTFEQPGLVVLGCNIHDKMVAFVGIVDSPYFTKLSASGSAVLNLPAGRYRLRVWHPNLTAPVAFQNIAVETASQIIPIVLSLDRSSAAVAPWPE